MLEGLVGVVVFSCCLLVADQIMEKQKQKHKDMSKEDAQELLEAILHNENPELLGAIMHNELLN